MKIRWRIAQFLELRWWANYLSRRPVDGYLAWKRQYWADFLSSNNIVISPKEKILDAGCGPAGLFTVFPEYEVTAIDPLLDRYEKRLAHFRRENHPNVRFHNLPLESLDCPSRFDLVFCINAINHVADMEAAVGNLCKALVPGGRLYLTVDVHHRAFWKMLFRLVPGDVLHPQQADLQDYSRLLLSQGLYILSASLLKKEFFFHYYLIVAVRPPASI